jgi:hypothetical protein
MGVGFRMLIVGQDHKDEQYAKADSWHVEELDGNQIP